MKNLAPYGNVPVQHKPGLWMNKDQNMVFSLVVDHFGIKFNSLNNLQHLITALKTKNTTAVDITGSLHIGVNLDWN